MKRISWTGLALCTLYLLLSGWLVYEAQTAGDPKGRFVLMQLPIALQLSLLHALGLGAQVRGMGWAGSYLLLVPPLLAVLYTGGWLLGRIARRGIALATARRRGTFPQRPG